MSVALARLAFASTRVEPRDRVIDCVVGLEALLIGPENATELRFRFSLNYAMLQTDPTTRPEAFQRARDLYDLRSRLAHGGTVSSSTKIGSTPHLPLTNVADIAWQMLSETISACLDLDPATTYLASDFWKKKYFGLV
ncbi:MAG: hypothetical protein AB7I25_03790 [Vicinamibacterales bacterium]